MHPVKLQFSNGGTNSTNSKKETNFSVMEEGDVFVVLHYLFRLHKKCIYINYL